MKLSIIIPVYNVEQYISRCLDSILNQDIPTHDFEILLINDGSKDNSILFAEQYEKKYSNIHIHHQENGGIGNARNKGISLSKGEYIYFVDSDDYLAKNVLKSMVDTLYNNELDVLTFQCKYTSLSDFNESRTSEKKFPALEIISGVQYLANNSFKTEVWWYAINKEFLIKTEIKFIEGEWLEDAAFTIELFLKAKFMAHIPLDVYRYVNNPESAMNSKNPSHYLKLINGISKAIGGLEPLIETVDSNTIDGANCKKHLKTRQQSFALFLMIRILKSRIKIKDIKKILMDIEKAGAYPFNSLLKEKYNSFAYKIIIIIFNNKKLYYVAFCIINPLSGLIRIKNKFLRKNIEIKKKQFATA